LSGVTARDDHKCVRAKVFKNIDRALKVPASCFDKGRALTYYAMTSLTFQSGCKTDILP
jgi:hypothetical protein